MLPRSSLRDAEFVIELLYAALRSTTTRVSSGCVASMSILLFLSIVLFPARAAGRNPAVRTGGRPAGSTRFGRASWLMLLGLQQAQRRPLGGLAEAVVDGLCRCISWSSKGRFSPCFCGRVRHPGVWSATKLLATPESCGQSLYSTARARLLGARESLAARAARPGTVQQKRRSLCFRFGLAIRNFKRGAGPAFGGRAQRNAIGYYYEFARSEASTLNAVSIPD